MSFISTQDKNISNTAETNNDFCFNLIQFVRTE